MCIDTGAGVSLLTHDVVRRLGMETRMQLYQGPAVHGVRHELSILGKISMLVTIGKTTRTITLLVVPQAQITFLLGNNTLQEYSSMVVNYHQKTLLIRSDTTEFTISVDDRAAMYAVESITIPAKSAVFMPCCVEADKGDTCVTLLEGSEATTLANARVVVVQGLRHIHQHRGQTVAHAHIANPG
jgi:hypothetical protein